MVLQCAFIKALRTGRLVYNEALRLVKVTAGNAFAAKVLSTDPPTDSAPAQSRGAATEMVNGHPRGRVPHTPDAQNTKFPAPFPTGAHNPLVRSNGLALLNGLVGSGRRQRVDGGVEVAAPALGF
jgi:hypothetical protein